MSTAAAPSQPAPPTGLRFDGFKKCFMEGDKTIPGLLPLVADRFFPKYSFTAATFNKDTSGETEHKRRKRVRGQDRRKVGVNAGIRLDKEIALKIRLTTTPAPPDSDVQHRLQRLSAPTKAFFEALRKLKLKPIRAQVPVKRTSKNGKAYATGVDVVCKNAHGQYVLVECKSGFTGYYRNCTQYRMKAPLQAFTDCQANQHQIQLAATREAYRETFPSHDLAPPIILHVEGTKVTLHALKQWADAIPSWAALLFD
jgi:hypothetical protein